MPFPNEHAARLRPPGEFDSKTFRTTKGGTIFGKLKVPQSVNIVWGKLTDKAKPDDPPLPQSLRFDKSEWTIATAKKWLKDNNVTFKIFEPAAKEDKKEEMAEEEVTEQELVNYAHLMSLGGKRITVADLDAMSDSDIAQYLRDIVAQMTNSKEINVSIFANTPAYDEDTAEVEIIPDTQELAETYDFEDLPIFKAGTFNKITYTRKHIDELVANFPKLSKLIKPVLKLGHGDQKFLKDSMPAVGWVTSLRRDGDVLLATFKQIPKRIHALLKNGAFKRFSAELYTNFKDEKGKAHGLVLKAAALLGADAPAIKSLPDIEALYNADNQIEFVALCFNEEGDLTFEEEAEPMADEKVKDKEKEVKDTEITDDKDTEITIDNKEATPDPRVIELEEQAKVATAMIDKLTTDMKSQQTEARHDKEAVTLTALKRAGKLLPAHEDSVLKLFDAVAGQKDVIKLSEEVIADDGSTTTEESEYTVYSLFSKFLEALPVSVDFKERSIKTEDEEEQSESDMEVDRGEEIVDQDIANALTKYMDENPDIDPIEAYVKIANEIASKKK